MSSESTNNPIAFNDYKNLPQRMYVLSVVTTILLTLTFVTGLLGMNVGGLPGLESPMGFPGSVVVMVVAAVGLIILFRWKKWL